MLLVGPGDLDRAEVGAKNALRWAGFLDFGNQTDGPGGERAARKSRGGGASASLRGSSASQQRAFAPATSCRFVATILSRIVDMAIPNYVRAAPSSRSREAMCSRLQIETLALSA